MGPGNYSAAIVFKLSTAMTSFGKDGAKVTLILSAIVTVNLQQDMRCLNTRRDLLQSGAQSEQAVVKMSHDSVDMKVYYWVEIVNE